MRFDQSRHVACIGFIFDALRNMQKHVTSKTAMLTLTISSVYRGCLQATLHTSALV